MFEPLLSALGVGVAKHLLGAWLGEGMPKTVGDELIGAVAVSLGDKRKARLAERRIADIRDGVIHNLEEFFATERSGKVTFERIAEALGATLEAAPTNTVLVRARLEPKAIARALAEACPEARASLDVPAQDIYDRALEASATALRAVAEKLPNFHTETAAAQLSALYILANNIDVILSDLHSIKSNLRSIKDRQAAEARGFEAIYRRALRQKVANLHLFGLPHHEDSYELDLDIAYIPLRLQHKDERLSIDLAYPEILALLPGLGNRLLIEGAAGSGKSTLLQWTALKALDCAADSLPTADSAIKRITDSLLGRIVTDRPPDDIRLPQLLEELGFESRLVWAMASRAEPGNSEPAEISTFSTRPGRPIDAPPWWQRLPIHLRLRDCPNGRLPSPDELPNFVARQVGNAPEGWLRKILDSGDALLLVDGIDEVPIAKRKILHESLDHYAGTYPDVLIVVTSRSAAVREDRWARSFRHRFAVEPMQPEDITAFIAQWHAALWARRPQNPSDPDVPSLTRQVLGTAALIQLAETPLLCAAICYLHLIERGEIPRRTARLYASITKQLVHQLDIDRLQREGYERLVPAFIGLDLDDKLSLLARLALAMVRDEQSTLSRDDALPTIREGLAALHKSQDATELLAAMQERSGVLRGASEEVVEFSHNALKTYLAAKRLVAEAAGKREVIRLAEATADPDLILLTGAEAAIPYREQLVKKLLDLSASEETTKRHRQILALRCSVEEVATPALRERLEALMLEVFPPRNFDEAAALADLGDRAVPHLRYQPELDAARNAASVRCLKRIATPTAKAMLESYLNTESLHVAAELTEVVHPLRIQAVSENKLDCEIAAPGRRSDLRTIKNRIYDVAPLIGRTDVQRLDLSRTAIVDTGLDQIDSLTGLRELWLDETTITDAGLVRIASLTKLQALSLNGTGISDDGLAHIADLPVLQALSLDATQISDTGLIHIANIRSLKALSLDETEITDAGLSRIRSLTGLVELWLSYNQITDEGLAFIANCKRLQTLMLGSTQITDAGLVYIASLTELESLLLTDTHVHEEHPAIATLRAHGVHVVL